VEVVPEVSRDQPQTTWKKYQLFQEVQSLGHIASLERVTTDLEKLEAKQRCPPPRNKHELRSFLGLCTCYRRFITGFADVAKLLTQLT
jgi:hypothetical protein